ncbi:fructosamine-3-kinase [Litorivivens lipolytica]|uniref:Fructosamine-3-kinase n=2 Tax=Litorivivens lipolytica TaxID=1524264 RepID=A0A7W4Z6H9_9GAMM|nr:fructosamine-3-kinase [Litorivivens lipolytica]
MVFTKINNTPFPDALEAEAIGLKWLRKLLPADVVSVPEVYAVDDTQMKMQQIDAVGQWSDQKAKLLAEGLAAMHRMPQPYYGFEESNYIGLNPQYNQRHCSWGEFFLGERLQVQVSMIEDKEKHRYCEISLGHMGQCLTDYLNEHCSHPSLVHGDLWRGNCLLDAERVWLIDPAVYFADREVDIAMTEFFGGFPSAFIEAYNRHFPLSSEYENKRDIYNLYHALNHYNLFGDSYWGECERGFDAINRL